MKKTLTSAALLLSITSLSLNAFAIGEDNGGAIDDMPLNYQNETEASAALLFLDLHNKGLAGGKSGVCIDLVYDADGRPQYKAGFDTSAFVTGSSTLQNKQSGSSGFNSDQFKKLVDALAKAQDEKVNVTIDGYADGQHYISTDYSLNGSIEKNEALSAERAKAVADLLKENPNLAVTSTRGHASPYWEKKYPSAKSGLDCPTRRKVVVTFKQPASQVKSELEGQLFKTPESMSIDTKKAIQQEFLTNVDDARSELGIPNPRRNVFRDRTTHENVEKVYARLIAQKKLNSKCDLPPFKQMTLAMIEYRMNNYMGTSPTRKEALIRLYMTESGFNSVNTGAGQSALEEGCLIPSKKIADQLSSGMENYAVSGSDFLNSSAAKVANGKVKIGFDVGNLSAQKIPLGPNKDQTLRGFYCKKCGNGLFFKEDPVNKGKFVPEYLDRIVRFKGDDQSKFINNLDALADSDPFSVGAFLKPRLYVIKNCKACKCDFTSLIRANSASVVKLDPMQGTPTSQDISTKEFEDACIIRPPVHHACNVAPNENKHSDKASFTQKFMYTSSLQNLSFQGANINELVNKVSNACPANSFGSKMTTEAKIKDVMCGDSKTKALPSEDEKEDCSQFTTQAAN